MGFQITAAEEMKQSTVCLNSALCRFANPFAGNPITAIVKTDLKLYFCLSAYLFKVPVERKNSWLMKPLFPQKIPSLSPRHGLCPNHCQWFSRLKMTNWVMGVTRDLTQARATWPPSEPRPTRGGGNDWNPTVIKSHKWIQPQFHHWYSLVPES